MPYTLRCSYGGCIYVHNCSVFLDWSLNHFVMCFFVSCNSLYFKSLLCLIGVLKYFSLTFIFLAAEYPIDKYLCSFAPVTEGFNGGCGGNTRLVRIWHCAKLQETGWKKWAHMVDGKNEAQMMCLLSCFPDINRGIVTQVFWTPPPAWWVCSERQLPWGVSISDPQAVTWGTPHPGTVGPILLWSLSHGSREVGRRRILVVQGGSSGWAVLSRLQGWGMGDWGGRRTSLPSSELGLEDLLQAQQKSPTGQVGLLSPARGPLHCEGPEEPSGTAAQRCLGDRWPTEEPG